MVDLTPLLSVRRSEASVVKSGRAVPTLLLGKVGVIIDQDSQPRTSTTVYLKTLAVLNTHE